MNITGEILKRLREKNDKTLEELVVDINERYNKEFKVNKIARWENGKSSILYDELKYFASYYNVATDLLLGFDLDKYVDIIDLRHDLEIIKMANKLEEKYSKLPIINLKQQ